MIMDIGYPPILTGGITAALILLLLATVRLLRKILVELREIRETIRSTATSDIELRLFGSEDD